jgi:DNA-binding CsgD family transcriptional regulator
MPRAGSGSAIIARVLPLSSRSCWGEFAPHGDLAALFLTDPDVERPRPIVSFASIYALTARESRVLACIVEGNGLTKAAENLGVAVTTARTHLQSVFRKTGTTKQTELVRLFFDTTGY